MLGSQLMFHVRLKKTAASGEAAELARQSAKEGQKLTALQVRITTSSNGFGSMEKACGLVRDLEGMAGPTAAD